MANEWIELGAADPTSLVEARLQAHHAVQWVTRAARANLPAQPDDSHSNLAWDGSRHALVSHDLTATDGVRYVAGFAFEPLCLFLAKKTEIVANFALDGCRDREAGDWMDVQAAKLGLKPPGAVTLPYVLPAHPVATGGRYGAAAAAADFVELARWYAAAADVLEVTRAGLAAVRPGPSPLRCWPDHFDIATLVTLRAGDAETAPSIGIGLSPGDDNYPQPYFYVSPWPRPAGDLPSLPPPGHWHRTDFVAAVATGAAVLAMPDRRAAARGFIDAAVRLSRTLLKA